VNVAIIEYNAGNVRSVVLALKRLGIEAVLTGDAEKISSADKVIFPGVGEASSTMRYLRSNGLNQVIPRLKQPVLGICLGLQLLCSFSEENNCECLGVFPQRVKKFSPPQEQKLKVPHIGWNSITALQGELFTGIKDLSQVYFIHSYFAELGADTSAKCNYILDFSAALQKNNFYAVQFHPEKSAEIGEHILKNFLAL